MLRNMNTPNEDDDRLRTLADLAKMLQVSRSTAYRLR